MSNPSDILGLIDAAVHNWEYGPDAARWRPHAESGVKYSEPMLSTVGSEAPATFTEIRFDTVPAARRLGEPPVFRMPEGMVFTLSVSTEQVGAMMERLGESMRALARAFSTPPKHPSPCFCHPAPFPAARDYRRRTKHRNRRHR